MNREPGVRLINPHGITVTVQISRVSDLLLHGFKRHKSGLSVSNKDNHKMIVFRPMGGMGDMISILPAIEQLAKLDFELSIAFPGRYHYLFSHIKAKLIDYCQIYDINEFLKDYGYLIDLGCPAAEYEFQSDFRIIKNRIENFSEACGFEEIAAMAPAINFDKSYGIWLKEQFKDQKIIGLAIKSGHKSKDWPYFNDLAETLVRDGYGVITFDEINVLDIPGVVNVIKVPDDRVMSMLNGLDCLISLDSGLMWGALSQGIKTAALFGPTNGPVTLKHFDKSIFRIIQKFNSDKCQRPCYYYPGNNWYCHSEHGAEIGECMKEITVDSVIDAMEDLIHPAGGIQ